MSNYIIGDTKLAVLKDRLVREESDMEGESTQPNDSADSAPSHKRKKLGVWLKLANQELESAQATCSSIPVEAKIRKEVEDYLL